MDHTKSKKQPRISGLNAVNNFSDLSTQYIPRPYTAFAFFMSFIYMTGFFLPGHAAPPRYHWLMPLQGIGILFCTGILLAPYWPKCIKKYFTIYWYVAVGYCLPFSFALLFLLNHYPVAWLWAYR